jgi:histidinol-phosphate/aromatic aminotransferase/cobyric acid decarboxylase-like protein
VKYGYFATPRVQILITKQLRKSKEVYQPGDTVFYPAPRFKILSEMDRTFLPYSVQDAQLTNLYLPKDAQYVQAMDTTQTEVIWIKKPNNPAPVEIKRLKGLRYGSE